MVLITTVFNKHDLSLNKDVITLDGNIKTMEIPQFIFHTPSPKTPSITLDILSVKSVNVTSFTELMELLKIIKWIRSNGSDTQAGDLMTILKVVDWNGYDLEFPYTLKHPFEWTIAESTIPESAPIESTPHVYTIDELKKKFSKRTYFVERASTLEQFHEFQDPMRAIYLENPSRYDGLTFEIEYESTVGSFQMFHCQDFSFTDITVSKKHAMRERDPRGVVYFVQVPKDQSTSGDLKFFETPKSIAKHFAISSANNFFGKMLIPGKEKKMNKISLIIADYNRTLGDRFAKNLQVKSQISASITNMIMGHSPTHADSEPLQTTDTTPSIIYEKEKSKPLEKRIPSEKKKAKTVEIPIENGRARSAEKQRPKHVEKKRSRSVEKQATPPREIVIPTSDSPIEPMQIDKPTSEVPIVPAHTEKPTPQVTPVQEVAPTVKEPIAEEMPSEEAIKLKEANTGCPVCKGAVKSLKFANAFRTCLSCERVYHTHCIKKSREKIEGDVLRECRHCTIIKTSDITRDRIQQVTEEIKNDVVKIRKLTPPETPTVPEIILSTEGQLEKLKQENKNMKLTLDKLKEDLESWTKKVSTKNEEIAKRDKEIEAVRYERKMDAENAQAELKVWKRKVELMCTSKDDEGSSKRLRLEDDNSLLRKEVEQLTLSSTTYRQNRDKAIAEMKEKQNAFSDLSMSHKDLESKYKTLSDSFAQVQDTNQRMLTELTTKDEQMQDLQNSNVDLSKHCQYLGSKLEKSLSDSQNANQKGMDKLVHNLHFEMIQSQKTFDEIMKNLHTWAYNAFIPKIVEAGANSGFRPSQKIGRYYDLSCKLSDSVASLPHYVLSADEIKFMAEVTEGGSDKMMDGFFDQEAMIPAQFDSTTNFPVEALSNQQLEEFQNANLYNVPM